MCAKGDTVGPHHYFSSCAPVFSYLPRSPIHGTRNSSANHSNGQFPSVYISLSGNVLLNVSCLFILIELFLPIFCHLALTNLPYYVQYILKKKRELTGFFLGLTWLLRGLSRLLREIKQGAPLEDHKSFLISLNFSFQFGP